MTNERAREIKVAVFDEYYGRLEYLSSGFDGYDHALNFGRVLGMMESALALELAREVAEDGVEDKT